MKIKTIKNAFKIYSIILVVLLSIMTFSDAMFYGNYKIFITTRIIFVVVSSVELIVLYKSAIRKLNKDIAMDAYEIASQLKQHRYGNTKQLDEILKAVEEVKEEMKK